MTQDMPDKSGPIAAVVLLLAAIVAMLLCWMKTLCPGMAPRGIMGRPLLSPPFVTQMTQTANRSPTPPPHPRSTVTDPIEHPL